MKSVEGFGVNSSIRKKHLKVVILDLYVKWLTDPAMYSSFYRAHWYYQDIRGRYNKLFITKVHIFVVDALEALGYLISTPGHYDRDGGHSSHMSRMKATDKLINKIVNVFKFSSEMVDLHPNTECVVMRKWDDEKNKQVNIEYQDNDFSEITRWRHDLTAYNNLLRATYIDIPDFPEGGLVTGKSKKDKYKSNSKKYNLLHKIHISQHEKFVKRIFNNNNWEHGGRFYGGWWQRIPSEWRTRIRIGNMPVSEIDYKGLHIVLLYAIKGINYRDDPYTLDGFEVSQRMRNLLKQVLLCSINASDAKTAKSAIRKEINFHPEDYFWVKDMELDLSELIAAFVLKHQPINEYFFSNSGVWLQNLDSRIAESIINHFTQLRIPILCVHDSFVISADRAEDLKAVMEQTFLNVINEYKLPINITPRTTQSGLEVGQWSVILSDPNWRDVRDRFLKEPYDYPKWHKNLTEFKAREFTDYYVT